MVHTIEIRLGGWKNTGSSIDHVKEGTITRIFGTKDNSPSNDIIIPEPAEGSERSYELFVSGKMLKLYHVMNTDDATAPIRQLILNTTLRMFDPNVMKYSAYSLYQEQESSSSYRGKTDPPIYIDPSKISTNITAAKDFDGVIYDQFRASPETPHIAIKGTLQNNLEHNQKDTTVTFTLMAEKNTTDGKDNGSTAHLPRYKLEIKPFIDGGSISIQKIFLNKDNTIKNSSVLLETKLNLTSEQRAQHPLGIFADSGKQVPFTFDYHHNQEKKEAYFLFRLGSRKRFNNHSRRYTNS